MAITGTPQSGSTAWLCTLDDIKARLGIVNTDSDDIIGDVISGVTSMFETYCDRPLIAPAQDVTEYYSGVGDYLQVRRYPLIAIATLKESYSYNFASATAMTANTDYRILNDGNNGVIMRMYVAWSQFPDSVQIIYRGGYCAAGVTPGDGEHQLPDDLREAAIQQVCLVYKRKDDIGLSSVTFDGSAMQKNEKIDLLPLVKATLKKYRRTTL